jgi:alpha-L-rhamnosidase
MPIDLTHPPREYSVMPFWFWNDALKDREIVRQIAEFDAQGVYGFVIHPRVGLPREIGWMSDAMLRFMRVAIDEAARRDMKVVLYDEGMYPSGSSSGQVVATDPTLACRCLACEETNTGTVVTAPDDVKVVLSFERGGKRYRLVDRKVDSFIRGLHYIDESKATEDEPPAGDILNPRTADLVLKLVHDKFAGAFGQHFGKTIVGVFTDEPGPLGRCREKNVRPFTTGLLDHLQRLTGHDFLPDLPALFFDDIPNAKAIREKYALAVRSRLEETWYAPLHAWCEKQGLWLMGHPDAGDEIGVQKHFHVPGQDLVWRWVEPGNKNALEGPESTQGKCASSAMRHAGKTRNSNEMAGAYGHQTTFDEIQWLAHWLFARGCNLLIPHAFYYSIRGPRKDERPPQLGPHTPEWRDGTFKRFADACRRLSWLNATATPLIDVAILTHDDRCPWPAAKACFEQQVDFDYLTPHTLLEGETHVDASAVRVKACRYDVLIVDGDAALTPAVRKKLEPLIASGHVLRYDDGTVRHADDLSASRDATHLVVAVRHIAPARVWASSAEPALRLRHLHLASDEFVLCFNEGTTPIDTTLCLPAAKGVQAIDPATGKPIGPAVAADRCPLRLARFDLCLLHLTDR